MTDKEKLEAIRAEIHRLVNVRGYDVEIANDLFTFMDSLPNEPVSEDLEEASKEWLRPQLDKSYANYGEAKMMELTRFDGYAMLDAIEFGAKRQKSHSWKPADGDDLPEYDREVIVLIKYNTQRNIHDKEYSTYRVGFGHRPNPNGWDGKNIDTNEVTHYTPKLYNKGGWNVPDIAYWLDIKLPKEIEP